MKALLKYDLLYMHKTTKVFIMLGLGIFLAALSVLTARYMNELMQYAMAQEGIGSFPVSEPTVMDAYIQFYSNMQQIFFLVFLFIAGAFFSKDISQGIEQWLFARPVSKTKYMLSKTLVIHLLGLFGMLVAALFFAYSTVFIFDGFSYWRFIGSLFIFYVFVLFFVQLLMLLVGLFGRMLWPMLISVLVFFVLSAFSPIDGGFFKYTPLRLPAYALSFIMEDVATGDLIWTIVIGLGLSVFLSVLGIFLFNKQLYKQ
jgi:ABC-2 type transport system permease protein